MRSTNRYTATFGVVAGGGAVSGPGLADLMRDMPTIAPPRVARRHTLDDEPEAEKETDMPKGVYERKPKKEGAEAAPPVGKKPRKKWTRRKGERADVKTLAAAQLITAAKHLHAAVAEHVEVGDNEPLQFAIDNFAAARAIYEAV